MPRLKPCKGCGEAVHTSAKSCPKCGCRYPTLPQWVIAFAAVVSIGAGVFVAVFVYSFIRALQN